MVPTLSQIVSSFRMPGPARFSNNNINGQFLSPKGDATISRGGYSIITSTTIQLGVVVHYILVPSLVH